MRSRHKEWKNSKQGKRWNCRIIWFDESASNDLFREDIRLQMEDMNQEVNVYPKTQEKADEIWNEFKLRAAAVGHTEPVIVNLRSIKDLV